jgi:hypothetical protein
MIFEATVQDLIARLAQIRSQFGKRAFDRAVANARLGIARSAHEEAERRAGRNPAARPPGVVVLFPLSRARRRRTRTD